MATAKLNPDFATFLEPFGIGAADFFVAAGFYLAVTITSILPWSRSTMDLSHPAQQAHDSAIKSPR
jgi:hypothetical protein